MSLKIGTINASIETSKVLCPISYKFDMEVLSGAKLTFSQKTKFLAGSKMVIDKGATVIFNQPCVFYQENQSLQKKGYNQYPNKLNKATLINNGSLELNSSFGGFIDVNGIDAVVKTATNFSNNISSKEASTFSKSFVKVPEAATTFTITTNANGLIAYNGASSPSSNVFVKETTFLSAFSNNDYFWTGEVETNVFMVLSTKELKSLNSKATLTISLVPNSSYYDLSTIKWSYSKQKSKYKDQTLNVSSDKLSADFVASGNPGTYWAFGTHSYEHVYNITFEIRAKEEFGGKTFTIKSEDVAVYGW